SKDWIEMARGDRADEDRSISLPVEQLLVQFRAADAGGSFPALAAMDLYYVGIGIKSLAAEVKGLFRLSFPLSNNLRNELCWAPPSSRTSLHTLPPNKNNFS